MTPHPYITVSRQSAHVHTDPFHYNAEYQILCCKYCVHALQPHLSLSHHLTAKHARLFSRPMRASILTTHTPEQSRCLPVKERQWRAVDPHVARIPFLPYEIGAYACLLCNQLDNQRMITPSRGMMLQHIHNTHATNVSVTAVAQYKDMRGRISFREYQKKTKLDDITCQVACQSFFTSSPCRRWFEVERPTHAAADRQRYLHSNPDSSPPSPSIADGRAGMLARLDRNKAAEAQQALRESHYTTVDPWGEKTHWPAYLLGHRLDDCALLLDPPEGERDRQLTILHASLVRNIQVAREMIISNAESQMYVNEWSLRLLNSWTRGIPYRIPLHLDLLKPTWDKYTHVWKKLLTYLWRLEIQGAQPRPKFRLTAGQQRELDQCVRFADEIDKIRRLQMEGEEDDAEAKERCLHPHLDEHMLLLCIQLLDHDLPSNVFESVAVSFFAVLGIDPGNRNFHGPANYTSKLSGFIKLAQVFAIQLAITGATQGTLDVSASVAIDRMHDKFLHSQSGCPFAEALRLRTLGNKIRDNMTELGRMQWSVDGETLHYLDVTIDMRKFRTFIHTQVEIAQTLLAGLMAIDSKEPRPFEMPHIPLSQLRDRPVEDRYDYCYLDHPETQARCRPSYGELLLHRLEHSMALRRVFLCDASRFDDSSQWNEGAVRKYLDMVDRFLEHLLLLVHILSGQPGRSTEVIGLRLRNGCSGSDRRNVFIDSDGLIHTVTFWSKQYHTTGLPKLIHRYLPRQIGELLVHYQAVVLPFRDQLLQLALGFEKPPLSYLWTSLDPDKPGPWPKQRLTAVLQREAKRYLNIKYNTQINRHVMISISKFKQGRTGGFRRAFQKLNNVRDLQATHTSHTAGLIYAQLVETGERWVEAETWQFKDVSDEWHHFWGFGLWDRTTKLNDPTRIPFRAAILPIEQTAALPAARKAKRKALEELAPARSNRRVRARKSVPSSPSVSSQDSDSDLDSDAGGFEHEYGYVPLSEFESESEMSIAIQSPTIHTRPGVSSAEAKRARGGRAEVQVVIERRGWDKEARGYVCCNGHVSGRC